MSEVTSYAPGTPAWVELTTRDPDGARAFYGDVLGWDFDIGPPETGHYTNCRVRGRNVAGLSGMPADGESPTAWLTYIATGDADASAARIADAGGTVMMEPMDVMSFGRMAIAGDPTGAVFGLWQANEHIGAELVNEPGAMVWNELTTPDLDAAERFYGDVFGYGFAPEDTGEGGPAYRTFRLGGQDRPVGGMSQMDEGDTTGAPPRWGVCFAVADSDAAAARTAELGGEVTLAPMDSPYGRFALLRDPQGGAFAVMGVAPGE